MKLEWGFVKTLVIILMMTLSVTCYAQNKIPPNELPMYGGIKKTPMMLEADQKFIDSTVKQFGSREAASRQIMIGGWKYVRENNCKSAMKRFNQAWLLTPVSSDVLWGFGATLGCEGKYEESISYFSKADQISPNNGRLLTDFGRVYQQYAIRASKSKGAAFKRLDKSIDLFKKAGKLEPRYFHVYQNWAISLYFKGDYKGAWEKIEKAEKLDKQSIDTAFVRELSKAMPRPNSK